MEILKSGTKPSIYLFIHDDVIKWNHFPRYWPSVRGIHRSPVNSPHKSQWRGALMFSLICAWTNGWVNNSEPGDLRRHLAHYDVIVMSSLTYNYHARVWCAASTLLGLKTNKGFSFPLAYWSWNKMAAILQTKMHSLQRKKIEFRLKIHGDLFPRFLLTMTQHWFR